MFELCFTCSYRGYLRISCKISVLPCFVHSVQASMQNLIGTAEAEEEAMDASCVVSLCQRNTAVYHRTDMSNLSLNQSLQCSQGGDQIK